MGVEDPGKLSDQVSIMECPYLKLNYRREFQMRLMHLLKF